MNYRCMNCAEFVLWGWLCVDCVRAVLIGACSALGGALVHHYW